MGGEAPSFHYALQPTAFCVDQYGGSRLREWKYLAGFIFKKQLATQSLCYSKKPFFFRFSCFHGNGSSHQPLSQWLQEFYAAFCSCAHGKNIPLFLFVIFVNGQVTVIVKPPQSATCHECVQQRELHMIFKKPSSFSLLLNP